MSYDIDIRCPHCGRGPELPNPTYNLTPIFDLALTGEPLPNPEVGEGAVVLLHTKTDRPRGLRVLNGRKVQDTIRMLEAALQRIEDDVPTFQKLEPSNGWGDLGGAIETFRRMLDAARRCSADDVWEIR